MANPRARFDRGAINDSGCQTANLHATILHLLGLNHETLTWPLNGRDERLTDLYPARVIDDLLA